MFITVSRTEKEYREIERSEKNSQIFRADLKMTEHHEKNTDEFCDVDPFNSFFHVRTVLLCLYRSENRVFPYRPRCTAFRFFQYRLHHTEETRRL